MLIDVSEAKGFIAQQAYGKRMHVGKQTVIQRVDLISSTKNTWHIWIYELC